MSNMDLKKLNHRHDQIAEWLVINGDKTLTQCARHFKYSISWMSQVVNSDMFQALYVGLCRERQVAAVHSISSKMNSVAGMALDKIVENLANETMLPGQYLETASSMLDRLGYGAKNAPPAGGTNNTQNNYFLSREDITGARDRARDGRTPQLEAPE